MFRELAGGFGCGGYGFRILGLLGGSWVEKSGVISRVTIIITHIRGLITPLITTHEPPSRESMLQSRFSEVGCFFVVLGNSGKNPWRHWEE